MQIPVRGARSLSGLLGASHENVKGGGRSDNIDPRMGWGCIDRPALFVFIGTGVGSAIQDLGQQCVRETPFLSNGKEGFTDAVQPGRLDQGA
jgi:hypothetical protein